MKKLSVFMLIALSFLTINDLYAGKLVNSVGIFVVTINLNKVNSITTGENSCGGCNSCISKDKGIGLPFREFPFVLFTFAVIIIVFFKRYKLKILFWTVGLACFAGLSYTASAKYAGTENIVPDELKSIDLPNQVNANDSDFSEEIQGKGDVERTAGAEDEFFPLEQEEITEGQLMEDEFEPLDQEDEFVPLDETEEFETFSEEDEFIDLGDTSGEESKNWLITSAGKTFQRTLIALLAVILAAIAFKYDRSRKFRTVFLLLSLLYFGFYTSGCPCMISSFQSFILLLLGEKVVWVSIIWITGLLLLSYFFGKIWCGWVCHLGAFQEFFFRPGKLKLSLSPGVQKIFRVIKGTALVTLTVQLIITRSNLYIKIDPFKVAFNMFSTNLTGYILLAALIVSSFFIYRPFCRSLCPVGLLMGWVSHIPGASVLQIGANCKRCKKCEKQCEHQAIISGTDRYQLKNSECIRCGDCIDACNLKAVCSNRSKE